MPVPGWLTASLAADAIGALGVPELELTPLRRGRRLAGTVTTVRVAEGDNLGLREIRKLGPRLGPVLVVHGSPTSRRAVMGEVVAAALAAAGFSGMVTDGLVRDAADLAALDFPVWARGTTPLGATKNGPYALDEALQLGGVPISAGDYLIADDDGVVIWPAGRYAELLSLASARHDSDAARLERARSGLGLD